MIWSKQFNREPSVQILYFRLRVVEISLPSLRQRREDVIPLAEHFLATCSKELGIGAERIFTSSDPSHVGLFLAREHS